MVTCESQSTTQHSSGDKMNQKGEGGHLTTSFKCDELATTPMNVD